MKFRKKYIALIVVLILLTNISLPSFSVDYQAKGTHLLSKGEISTLDAIILNLGEYAGKLAESKIEGYLTDGIMDAAKLKLNPTVEVFNTVYDLLKTSSYVFTDFGKVLYSSSNSIKDILNTYHANSGQYMSSYYQAVNVLYDHGRKQRNNSTLPTGDEMASIIKLTNHVASYDGAYLSDIKKNLDSLAFIFNPTAKSELIKVLDMHSATLKAMPKAFHIYTTSRYGVKQDYLPWHYSEKVVKYKAVGDNTPLRNNIPLGNQAVVKRINSGDVVNIVAATYNVYGSLWYLTDQGNAVFSSNIQRVEEVVVPTAPKPTEPKPTVPVPTAPIPTEPKPTEPVPVPTEPIPTEPVPTEPIPTEPKQEVIELPVELPKISVSTNRVNLEVFSNNVGKVLLVKSKETTDGIFLNMYSSDTSVANFTLDENNIINIFAISEGTATIHLSLIEEATNALVSTASIDVVVTKKYIQGLMNFSEIYSYRGQFFDVKDSAWYYQNIVTTFNQGLMVGISDYEFNASGNVTVAEAITLASRLHSKYFTGSDDFVQRAGEKWYQGYLDYAVANGIVTRNYSNFNRHVTRAEFAELLASSISQDDMITINSINTDAIPDVLEESEFGWAIYRLYRAGVIIGSDQVGRFSPYSTITRAEASAIISRITNANLRQKISL